MPKALIWFLSVVVISLSGVTNANAQPLGTFAWQLQPFCNRVIINVTQNGAVYTFDGFDDQCGGSNPRAPLVGTGTANPDSTIGFGLNIVTAPGGAALHVDARITLPSVSGTWRDSAGNSGAFVLGAASGGPTRPLPGSGDITSVTAGTGLTGGGTAGAVTLNVDPTTVQSRITAACPAGQSMVSVNQNGTVNCQTPAGGGGTITAVNTLAGSGLTGGATSGAVDLAVVFAGTGTAATSARSDHNHAAGGQFSVAVGPGALAANGGQSNTAVGVLAVGAASSGTSNTAVGARALRNSPATGNTAVGADALTSATAPGMTANTAVGNAALAALTAGGNNTAVGHNAMVSATGGSENTAVGVAALAFNTTGTLNAALGAAALSANTTGFANLAAGAQALALNTTGSSNTAVGAGAGALNINGGGNVAVGEAALLSSITGNLSTAVGRHALVLATVGENTAIGAFALDADTTGTMNSAVGQDAMGATTTGNNNVAVGRRALAANTTGSFFTAIGADALLLAPLSDNTAVGFRALAETQGTENTAVGGAALDNATGSGNVGIGDAAFGNLTSGDRNVGVGYRVGVNLTSGSDNLFLASNGNATESNTTRIGGILQTRAFIAGVRGVATGVASPIAVLIDSNGQLGTQSSSRRSKTDIEGISAEVGLKLHALRPVQFHYKQAPADGAKVLEYGLIAEEVEAVLPDLVAYNADGEVETVKYHVLPALLLAEVQRLEKERAAMARELAELRDLVKSLVGTTGGLAEGSFGGRR